jgi:putative endonuclease
MAGISIRGAAGEVLAAQYLRKKGYTILAANYRCRFGEIDIIAADKKYIAFVEVKLRGKAAIYTPEEAVTAAKQQKIIKTAQLYLQTHFSDLQPRFDVIAITTDKQDPMKVLALQHLVAAFDVG